MAEQTIIIRKKVVKGHAAHHGGSWKVAYADFVTAMMAFFMVMWLVGLSQDVRDRIQGYFNDPLGFAETEPKSRSLITMEGMPQPKPGQTKAPGEQAFKSEQNQLDKLKRRIESALEADPTFAKLAKGVQITESAEGLLIEFAETKGAVFFESGSSVIRPEARKLVDAIAPILAQSGHTLDIQGHTDAQPYKDYPAGNWGLSTERALSLQQALLEGGVGETLFGEVSGFAARQLLSPRDPTDFSNRRVTILIPRHYRPGDKTPEPADALRDAIAQGTSPQAVIVKPESPDLGH